MILKQTCQSLQRFIYCQPIFTLLPNACTVNTSPEHLGSADGGKRKLRATPFTSKTIPFPPFTIFGCLHNGNRFTYFHEKAFLPFLILVAYHSRSFDITVVPPFSINTLRFFPGPNFKRNLSTFPSTTQHCQF